MKKRTLLFSTLILSFAIACSQKNEGAGKMADSANVTLTNSEFISMDSGNKMIKSYLNSIQYLQNDTDLRSLIIGVPNLRKYIDSMPGSDSITNLKLMFAHTLPYINSGDSNKNAGYRAGALTLIIAAYNSHGNYVYYNQNAVLDYSAPCPTNCPPGTAGNPLLIP